MTQAALSYCAAELRRNDRSRFLTSLFAPSCVREDLFALYAFNLEIAKILETVSEPMLGRIRLQWWRETIDGIYDGKVRPHAVTAALAQAIDRHTLPREKFDRLIDAREADLDEAPPADLAALERYAEDSAGGLVALAARILHRQGADAAAGAIGRAQGLAGLLLAVPFRSRRGRIDLPGDRVAAANLSLSALREGKGGPALSAIVHAVALRARQALEEGRRARRDVPRDAVPALLVGWLAERQLTRLDQAGHDPFAPSLRRPDPLLPVSLTWAAWRGRY
jgi:NADH dehydrogenase [ubiquinone] 1 alpha subcomplex assembly factor 6